MIKTLLHHYCGDLTPWQALLLKDETRQVAGSYKYRSVYLRLRTASPGTTFVAASTGNHGLAVAMAARTFGHMARIFAPALTPKAKLRLIAEQGAELVLLRGSFKDCLEAAKADSGASGAIFVASFDDLDSIQGHRSMLEELADVAFDALFVPVGGGGLLAAALLHWPDQSERIVGVELDSVSAMQKSLSAGRRVTVDVGPSIAEGLNVPQVGQLPFEICTAARPSFVSVSEAEIKRAMLLLWEKNQIRAEGAGAIAFAGALKLGHPGRTAVCIVSGGNISSERFEAATREAANAPERGEFCRQIAGGHRFAR
jgi:threonine dehydratase